MLKRAVAAEERSFINIYGFPLPHRQLRVFAALELSITGIGIQSYCSTLFGNQPAVQPQFGNSIG